MNDYNRRRSDRAVRVQTFGREHAADFTAGSKASDVAYELPADFVTDLRADRDALTARNADKHADNQEGVENTSAIDTLLAKAQTLVIRLDAAILNKYARDPDKLAAWKSATHVERTAKKEKPAEPTPPPPAT